jgi:hypothetical protein
MPVNFSAILRWLFFLCGAAWQLEEGKKLCGILPGEVQLINSLTYLPAILVIILS